MEPSNFFDFQVFYNQHTFEFLLRLISNIAVIYILVRQIYFRNRKNRDYLFSFFLINLLVFFVCYLLNSRNLSIGFAFGIFAVFSILRFRTTTVPIKEMTYLFISITVAIINSLGNNTVSYITLIITNLAIIIFTFLLEKTWARNEFSKMVYYEKIDLIKPENHQQLLQDLRERTGLNIHRFEIGRIDFLRDIARIKIYYYETKVLTSKNFDDE